MMSSGKFAQIIVAFAITAGPALAGGTAEQRDACMSDAFRLCTSAIPDEGRVESCLRSAGPRLSPGCFAVFNPPTVGVAPTQVARGQGARALVNTLPAPSGRPLPSDDQD